jgi:uncharacterized protein YjbI with pentapeptide repeats
MSGSSLKKASLNCVYLTNANMSRADLRDATLDEVELTGADLSGANLLGISYDQFTLYSLAKAKLDGAVMSDKLKMDLMALTSKTSNAEGEMNLAGPT